jgi:hypothetical protein
VRRAPRAALAATALAAAALSAAPGPPAAAPRFTEITASSGVTFAHSFGDVELDNIVEGTGGGACVFDYDGDGRMDLYFPNGRWLDAVASNRGRALNGALRNGLYRNLGQGRFADVTEQAGVPGSGFGFGCAAADVDDDGDLDLLVLNYGPNDFYLNNGDGTFRDASAASGLADPRWSLNAAWIDYDRDGWLDVYVCNYLRYDDGKFRAYYAAQGYPGPLSYDGEPSTLYRNRGDGTFEDVSERTGVFRPGGRCMSAVAADLDGDGWPDLYQANDAMENYFFVNDRHGRFVEDGLTRGLAFGENGQGVSSMGPVVGDVNGDGVPDLFIPDMNYGSLLLREGERFVDESARSGLAVMLGQYTGWGGVLFDADDDGHLDLFVANGNAHHEYPESPVLALGDGGGGFAEVSRAAGDYFQGKYVARGATWGDLDGDGEVDLVVVDLDGPPHLLLNEGVRGRHGLTIDVREGAGARPAIGSRVAVAAEGGTRVAEVMPVNGYLSQGDAAVHVGLGAADHAARLTIRWPDGRSAAFGPLEADRTYRADEPPR